MRTNYGYDFETSDLDSGNVPAKGDEEEDHVGEGPLKRSGRENEI